MKSIFISIFLFVIGAIVFAVVYPSFYSPSGNYVQTTVSAVYGIFLSFFLVVFHLYWRRTQMNTAFSISLILLKSFGSCLLICTLFLGYQYFFGSILGNRLNNEATAKAELNLWAQKLESFKLKCGRFPSTGEGLKVLVRLTDKKICPNYPPEGFFPEGVVWGHDFEYESDGTNYILKRNAGGEIYMKTNMSDIVFRR